MLQIVLPADEVSLSNLRLRKRNHIIAVVLAHCLVEVEFRALLTIVLVVLVPDFLIYHSEPAVFFRVRGYLTRVLFFQSGKVADCRLLFFRVHICADLAGG